MKYTSRFKLKKPELTDYVNIQDLNDNMDILDEEINKKVDKVSGKVLSTNDYTNVDKNKLAGIEKGARKTKVLYGSFVGNGDSYQTMILGMYPSLIFVFEPTNMVSENTNLKFSLGVAPDTSGTGTKSQSGILVHEGGAKMARIISPYADGFSVMSKTLNEKDVTYNYIAYVFYGGE